ncbi:MAG: hypothetical protein ABJA35_14730 [Parafilimonas sp.]
MRRGNLFFIGVISTVVTIISLNVAFGKSGYYNEHYPFYNRYHNNCNSRYNERYRDGKKYNDEKQQRIDSTNSNY